MYELCNVKNNTYYINCPAKIGLYVNGTDVYLIDSGNDKDAGKKVKRILDEHGWSLKCIINTHSHADHISGNKYLQQQTGCDIYAKGIEKAFTLYPILEPSFLGSSHPSRDLLHKFLYAQESICKDLDDLKLPEGFEIIDLPGHSFEMIGIKTPDGVLFAADCVSSPATIEKYGISFLYDVKKYLETLDFLCSYDAELFVPAHSEVVCDMSEIVTVDKNKVLEIIDVILGYLSEEKTFEDLLSHLFDKYKLVMTNEQYVLIGSTVKSYLSYLKDEGKIQSFFSDNRMYLKTV